MSKDPKSYSLEEKTKICLEATSGDDSLFQQVLENYNIDRETLHLWMKETGVNDANESSSSGLGTNFTVEMDDETAESTRFGVSHDRLNYKKLTFWAFFGSAVILVMVLSIIFIYEFSFSGMNEKQSVQNEYFDIQELRLNDETRLSSFGVVDEENGIYHVPVDSVISKMTSP